MDLSGTHRPLTELFEVPVDAGRFRLREDQLQAFHLNGFVQGVRVLSPAQVDRLREELEPLLDPAHPENHLFYEYHANESGDPEQILLHALGAWRIAPAFHDLLWNPAITVPAGQLLGGAVRFWHDQLFVKPPRQGGVVAWHQDFSYWTRTQPMAHLTCWIALDDTEEDSGPVSYVPGSHTWDLLPITGLTGDMNAIREVLDPEQLAAFQPVPMTLPAGVASFHHPLTVHGSIPNRSEKRRRAVALNFCLDGTRSASDDPLLAGVPVIPSGEPLDGQFFPLLYDPRG